MEAITLNALVKAEADVSPRDLEPGKLAYPEFLRFFRQLQHIDRHDFVIGAHFAYGWMPRMLNLRPERLAEAIRALNRAKAGEVMSADDLAAVKAVINGSMVGASKVLHFVNPDVYPIWDSNVAAFVRFVEHRRRPPEAVLTYMTYLGRCHEIVRDRSFTRLHASINAKLHYNGFTVSRLRALELVLWVGGKKLSLNRRRRSGAT